MRVAVFDNVPEGGAKRVVFEQVKYLSTHGHQVTCFTSRQTTMFPFEHYAKVRRYSLSKPRFKGWKRPLEEWWLRSGLKQTYRQIATNIEAAGVEAVIVHPCQHTQAPWLLQLLTLPTLYFIEEPLRVVYEPTLHPIGSLSLVNRFYTAKQRKLLQRLDKANVQASNLLVANSHFTARNVACYYNLEAQANLLGVDGRVFKPTKAEIKDYFLFIGDKQSLNGYPLLHRVAKKRSELRVQVIDFSEKKFRYSDKELAQWYGQAVATVCLARREPFGLVALESMACGTPVIALNEGGYKETVVNQRTGLLIKPTSRALEEAMDFVLHHKARVQDWRRQAREHVLDNFTWQQHGRRLEENLKHLVNL